MDIPEYDLEVGPLVGGALSDTRKSTCARSSCEKQNLEDPEQKPMLVIVG